MRVVHASKDGISQAIAEAIVLCPANPEWPTEFATERQRLFNALPQRFVAIEHFGSTAVPGLIAKPVIDILASLVALDQADSLIEPLKALGYHYPREFNRSLLDSRWLMRQDHGRRTHHLHLVAHGGERWRRELAFRNLLRSNPEVVARYAELKLRLAGIFSSERERYTDGKSQFIASVLRASA